MSEAWIVVAGAGLGTLALKGAGPVLLGRRALPPTVQRMLGLLAPAVFAALVVTETFGAERALVVDHRVIGLAVAGIAVLLRAPLVLVIVLAAAATAVARLLW